MKKLTAGIFAGILTIVTVNAARADIATTNYVNQNVNTIVGALDDLKTTDKDNAVAAINEVKSGVVSVTADVATLKGQGAGSIEKMIEDAVKGTDDEDGVVGAAIKEAVADLTSELQSQEGSVVKTIKQTNGEVVATFGKVAKADLDAALSKEISDNAAAIETLTGTGEGSIAEAIEKAVSDTDGVVGSAITDAIDSLDVEKQAAANKFVKTITQTDGKVSVEFAAVETDDITDNSVTKAKLATKLSGEISNNTNITTKLNGDDTVDGSVKNLIKTAKADLQANVDGKVDANTGLENMLLTADKDGQLANATTLAGEKPAACATNDCMLVSTGAGFEWQVIVNTYTKAE